MIPECGTINVDGDSLRVESECPVTFMLAARTNYRMQYPDYRAPARIRSRRRDRTQPPRQRSTTPQYFAPPPEDHQALFRRVQLRLGAGAPKLPTDKLRAQYGTGNAAADRQLEQLYFQYGRYLLIASRARARCPPTCRACGTTRPRRRGMPTTTSTSTCR